jgi:hypothetical protein
MKEVTLVLNDGESSLRQRRIRDWKKEVMLRQQADPPPNTESPPKRCHKMWGKVELAC